MRHRMTGGQRRVRMSLTDEQLREEADVSDENQNVKVSRNLEGTDKAKVASRLLKLAKMILQN